MKAIVAALALGAAAFAAGSACADVITFDDRGHAVQALGHYEGFDWSNISTVGPKKVGLGNTGYGKGVVSPKNVAFNDYGLKQSSVSVATGTFTFESAYFTAAWIDGLKLTIVGLADGVQKYKQTLTLNTKGPQLFQADWAGVDKLTFETYINDCTDKGRQFVMDNFKFVSGVPEPSTWALMIAGFGGVGVMIRADRRRSLAAEA
ncbi:MAG: hypothetical protein ABS77_00670 [Phenylobacterium sp. SCN 69-14]|nr:MAG: hypothetical protein ABS77_00670 [Phenylobacterium sp. SCN 69-14]